MKKGKHRFNMILTDGAKERLDRLIMVTDSDSMATVIRTALSIYDECMKTELKGGQVILRERDGSECRLVFVM